MQFRADRILFPLKELLGEKPAGIFDLTLKGPKKVKAEFRLRLWPKLLVQNYSKEFPSPIESRSQSGSTSISKRMPGWKTSLVLT